MPGCALLTIENLDGYIFDDDLLLEPLERLGFRVESVPWRATDVDWKQFDAVIVRTTWDYTKYPELFIKALEGIHRSGTRLENPLELIRWNLSKTYLRDLEQRGLPVVPTTWSRGASLEQLEAWWQHFGELVVKPVISASANDTYRISSKTSRADLAEIAGRFVDRDLMAQPFIRSVVDEGETSVFFFGGAFSHAVLKSPKSEDFRVQEEHGGVIRKIEPSEEVLALGQRVLAALDPAPLYARIDFVRHDGRWLLMEVELIEPSLYLRYDPASAGRFADALHAALVAGA